MSCVNLSFSIITASWPGIHVSVDHGGLMRAHGQQWGVWMGLKSFRAADCEWVTRAAWILTGRTAVQRKTDPAGR